MHDLTQVVVGKAESGPDIWLCNIFPFFNPTLTQHTCAAFGQLLVDKDLSVFLLLGEGGQAGLGSGV